MIGRLDCEIDLIRPITKGHPLRHIHDSTGGRLDGQLPASSKSDTTRILKVRLEKHHMPESRTNPERRPCKRVRSPGCVRGTGYNTEYTSAGVN